MAPKPTSLSHQPTKEKEEREETSSDEEEDDDDVEEEEKSEAQSPKGEQENSSGEETEEGSSEDEEEGEDKETVKSNKLSNPLPKPDSKPISQENGSDSDAVSEGSPDDYKLQPIIKSPVSSSKRRRKDGDESQDSSKRSKLSKSEEKKPSSTANGGSGLGCISRLWRNEDEVAVLNGMIEFRNAKGLDPNADMGAFYNFIKGKLQDDFSKDQLRTKITRMKKRFLNAVKKGRDGSDPVFSKPHEDKVFELSKKVWGGAVENGVSVKNENAKNAKKDVVKAEKDVVDEKLVVKKEKDGEEGDFWSKYTYLRLSFKNTALNCPSFVTSELIKEKLSLIGNVKAKELDEKWKQLMVEEIELHYKMLILMKEQVKMALDQ